MSLIEDTKETCVFIEKSRQSDGEGGFITNWTEGEKFSAAISFNNSMQGRIAAHQGVTSLYTVTTDKGVKLEYHEVFRRIRDGKVFRVTSDFDDMQAPAASSFSFEQVTAEEWELI